jgi:CRISPR/Cas system CSM-associated protein Csm3 (group 7 of RAMP superfamily)
MVLTCDIIDLRYAIAFQSPFHFGTGYSGTVNDRLARRDEKGFLVVPGSTIKGIVRENCERLARLFDLEVTGPHVPGNSSGEIKLFLRSLLDRHDIIHEIFGSQFKPGRLFFDDAVLDQECSEYFDSESPLMRWRYRSWQVESRTRVSMSRITRTARKGSLFTTEYGRIGLTFQGKIYGRITGPAISTGKGTYALILFLAGFKMLERLGADRSIGAGVCRFKNISLCVNNQEEKIDDWLKLIDELEYYQLDAQVGS